MFSRISLRHNRHCEHTQRVVVRSSGIERAVCETCGQVSFVITEGLSGVAERDRFRREIQQAEPVLG